LTKFKVHPKAPTIYSKPTFYHKFFFSLSKIHEISSSLYHLVRFLRFNDEFITIITTTFIYSMINKKIILTKLKQSKNEIFEKYPIKSLALFGSHARDEASEKSDVDILVEFSKPTAFEIVDLTMDLEKLFQKKVDVVSKKGLKPSLYTFVEKDLIYV
jgi:uncharacterized protein